MRLMLAILSPDTEIVCASRPFLLYSAARAASPAEEAIMRTIIPVALALAGMSLINTLAAAGSWCGTFRLGSTSCGFSSSEECLAYVRGLGGFCQPNPFPGTAYGTSAGSWNSPEPAKQRYRRAN